jgi:cytochrome c peroxidase
MILGACDHQENASPDTTYQFRQPANFPQATYTFGENPVTKEGFELGRKLFYDPILSVDSTVSCSTCHRQTTGFADPTHRINHGVNNRFGKRNSPGIVNMAFLSSFFLDGGVVHLDFVPVNAITSEAEMGNTLEEVVRRLSRHPAYAEAFRGAFHQEAIDSRQVLHALAQFTAMMVSANSKYDKVMRNEGVVFTEEEQEGHALFTRKCAGCHTPDLFTNGGFHNNGLDSVFDKDPGRATITRDDRDLGKFRVPGLRNVFLTPPYMHDGRFTTLEEVLDHYRSGVKDSPTLDVLLKQEGNRGISFTNEEEEKIIAFLKTLTDAELAKDKRFTDPF